MAAPTSQTDKLPIIPSEQGILKDDFKSLISLPWIQWFLALSAKINTINANSVGWAGVPVDSGVTPGPYGDSTHYPVFTVDVHGLITLASVEAVSGGGGNATNIVNATADHLVTLPDVAAGSSYKCLIAINSSSPNQIQLQTDATVALPIGSEVGGASMGTGQTSFYGVSGTSLIGPSITGAGQYTSGKATKVETNTWLISGQLPYSNYVLGYNAAVIADGAIAFWPLQETTGTTATEVIAGLNGTYAGGYTLNQTGPTGLGGKAVELNGSSGTITTAASTIISGAAFSCEIWALMPSYGNSIVFDHNLYNTFEIQAGTGGVINLIFSVAQQLASTSGQSTTAFLHIVFTGDASGLKCYINGTLNNSNSTAWPGGTSGSGIFSIGARGGASSFQACTVACAAVYNVVLTSTQVANHYSLGH